MRRNTMWWSVVLWTALGLGSVLCGCGGLHGKGGSLIKVARTGRTASDRREALAALKGRAEPYMRQDLEIILAQELDPAGRALAADLLGEIGDAAAAPELSRSVRLDTRWIVRQRALDALATVAGAAAADDIRHAALKDPRPEVRAEAVLLARRHLPRADAVPLLLETLSDRAGVVRLQTSAMLEELTGLRAAPDAESWRRALEAAGNP